MPISSGLFLLIICLWYAVNFWAHFDELFLFEKIGSETQLVLMGCSLQGYIKIVYD